MDENILGGNISDAIAKLKEHPEIISAVASALSGNNGNNTDNNINEEKTEAPIVSSPFPMEKLTEVMATLGPMLSEMGSSPVGKEIKGSREDHRYALLCALRPYLSDGRREMVDYVLKFGRIGDLLKKMK